MRNQTTIKNEVKCGSVGLHTGRKVGMILRPAPADTGVVFIRRDLDAHNVIPACFENVKNTLLATSIGVNGTGVSTVEHLLSAFSGLGVDNVFVEVDGPEVPIMDGSSLPYVRMLREARLVEQDKVQPHLVVKKEISVTDGTGWAMLSPAEGFRISCRIDFPHPLIGEQACEIEFSPEAYEEEVSPARTFGFLKEVEYLQAKGLALGGSLKNAIVLSEDKIINKEGLRHPEEFVRHKVLDAIGDLSLLGMPVCGHFTASKTGHKLNYLLLKELLSQPDNYQIVAKNGRNGQYVSRANPLPGYSAFLPG